MMSKRNHEQSKGTVSMTVSLNPLKTGNGTAVSPSYDEEMSIEEKKILSQLMPEEPCLHYPLKLLPMRTGRPALEYQIPPEDKQEVFALVYPFTDLPSLDEERLDIHADKKFTIRDFKVIRENNRNMLVSPYYAMHGGTVLDWIKCGEQMSVQVFRNETTEMVAPDTQDDQDDEAQEDSQK